MTRSPYAGDEARVGLVPERTLPAGRFEEDRTQLALADPGRAQADIAVRGPLLHRMDDAVGLVEALAAAGVDVALRLLVVVEPGDVRRVQVDLGGAVGHPFGDRLGDPGRLLDPDRGARPEALDLGRLAEDRHPVRRQGQHAIDGMADPDGLVSEDGRHQLEGLLQLELEVLLGERQLGRRQRGGRDRRDLIRVRAGWAGGRTSRPRGRRRAGARTCSCPCRGRSGTRSRRPCSRTAGTGPTLIIWWTAGVSGMTRPGHAGDPRAPCAAGDDDGVGGDVALVGADAADVAVHDVDAGDLGPGDDRQRAERIAFSRMSVPARSESTTPTLGVEKPPRMTDGSRYGTSAAISSGVSSSRLDAPGRRRRRPALELLHPLGRPRDLDAAALGEDAEFLVLADAVERQRRHLLRVIRREDEVGGVAGGAARVRQRALVEEDDVAPAEVRQVPGQAVADDAGADDDDLGSSRDGGHSMSPPGSGCGRLEREG